MNPNQTKPMSPNSTPAGPLRAPRHRDTLPDPKLSDALRARTPDKSVSLSSGAAPESAIDAEIGRLMRLDEPGATRD
jgi:hypothetical protein